MNAINRTHRLEIWNPGRHDLMDATHARRGMGAEESTSKRTDALLP
jgi:hypothetical protein